MITDDAVAAHRATAAGFAMARRTMSAGLCAALVWFGGVAGWTLLAPQPGRVLVIAPPGIVLPAASNAGAVLVEVHAHASVLLLQKRDGVRTLYANGAWLVLPAMDGGCVAAR